MAEAKAFPRWWLVAGGLAYGVYFTLGMAYFETYAFTHWALHLPVGTLFSAQGLLLAFRLLGGKERSRPGKTFSWMLGSTTAVGLLLYIYAGLVTPSGFGLSVLGLVYLHLLLVALLPLVALLVILQGRPAAKPIPSQAAEPVAPPIVQPDPPAAQVEPQTAVIEPAMEAPAVFHLTEEKAGEEFKVPLADLVFVEAADNYCKFHYFRASKPRSKTLRITMKEVEANLPAQSGFHRCHRSFLVNAARVEEVQGVSQAHRLKMEGFEAQVPVSRSFDISIFRKEG